MNELTVEARVAAPPHSVWRDLTDAQALAAWFWPSRFETLAAVDPRPEGPWEVRSLVAGIAVVGRVLSADPPRALQLTWRWEGEPTATEVEVLLADVADGATRVHVVHSGFATPEERDAHVQGWTDCLQRLVERHEAAMEA
jgi:uncharacterized protein YndB with AHSA1/START domain